MKKLFIILWVAILLSGCARTQELNQKQTNSDKQVCFKNFCFNVEIADTSLEREQGLMFREHLDQDKGMLFVFEDEAEKSFWMKNTKITLDIIFLNRDKKVVSIAKNAEPCKADPCGSYKSEGKARYVLEVNGGVSDEIGLKIGDNLRF